MNPLITPAWARCQGTAIRVSIQFLEDHVGKKKKTGSDFFLLNKAIDSMEMTGIPGLK